MARCAAEVSYHSNRATTAASRVSHALARFVEDGQPYFCTAWNGGSYGLYRGTVPFQTVAHGIGRFAQPIVRPNLGTMNNPD